jgi:hypothetical protein
MEFFHKHQIKLYTYEYVCKSNHSTVFSVRLNYIHMSMYVKVTIQLFFCCLF